jgi:hypothetical protein
MVSTQSSARTKFVVSPKRLSGYLAVMSSKDSSHAESLI